MLRVGMGYGQDEFPLAGMLIHKKPPDFSAGPARSTGVVPRKSTVYGLNGRRSYYIISLFKAT